MTNQLSLLFVRCLNLAVLSSLAVLVCPGANKPPTYPAGPQPSAAAPVAVAVDPARQRVYVVHRADLDGTAYNSADSGGTAAPHVPTDQLSVVNQTNGSIVARVPLGRAVGGEGQGIALDSTHNLIYVTNHDDGTVTMIRIVSPDLYSVGGTIPVGKNPEGIAVDSSGLVYVVNTGDPSVTLLNASGGSVTIPLPGTTPMTVSVDSVTHLAYVGARTSAGRVLYQINGASKTLQAIIPLSLTINPSGVAVDPGSKAYAVDPNTQRVSVIDLTQTPPRETTTFLGGAGGKSTAIAVDPVSHLVYVVNQSPDEVLVYNSAGQPQGSPVAVLSIPSAIAIDSSGAKAYVTAAQSDSVSVLSLKPPALLANWPLATIGWGLALDATRQRLYIANFRADTVSIVNTATDALSPSTSDLSTSPGSGPWAVAVDSSLNQLYAFGNTDGSLSVLSTRDGSLRKIAVGPTSAKGLVAVNPITNQVYITGATNTLAVLNGNNTSAGLTRVPVGNTPVGVAVDETANMIYVANKDSKSISVINGANNQVKTPWSLSPHLSTVSYPWGLAVDHDLNQLYITVTSQIFGFYGVNSNTLMTLNATTGAFVGAVPLPSNVGRGVAQSLAALVAVDRTTHNVFVTDAGLGAVDVVSGFAPTTILQQIFVGNGANGLAVDEVKKLVYVANTFDGTFSVIQDNFTAVVGKPPIRAK